MSAAGDMSDDDRVLAAEYVLGLLGTEEQRAFEARLADDQTLRDEVAARAEDFARLADDIPPVSPPQSAWDGISDRLFGRERPPGLLSRLGIGQALLGAAVAAGIAFAAVQLGLLTPDGQPEFRAELSGQQDSLRFRAEYDRDSGYLTLTRLSGRAGAGRSLEFWVIAGSAAPVSVMVWPTGAEREQIMLPAQIAAALPNATLAISEEPEGGSPTGAPTGPVLATAPVQPI